MDRDGVTKIAKMQRAAIPKKIVKAKPPVKIAKTSTERAGNETSSASDARRARNRASHRPTNPRYPGRAKGPTS